MMNQLFTEDRPLTPDDFKRGDQVIFVDFRNSIDVAGGVVSARNSETVHIKYSWFPGSKDNCSRAFALKPDYRKNIYPLWQLRHLTPQDDLETMKVKTKEANEKFRLNELDLQRMRSQVEREARDWRDNEIKKRSADYPYDYQYLASIAQSFGFNELREELKNG